MNYQIAIIGIFLLFALLEAKQGKLLKKSAEVSDDGKVELIGTLVLFVITQPLVLFSAGALMLLIVPQYQGALNQGALGNSSILLHIALLLIFDDMMQYWWHRLSHSTRFLYNLHRAHHNGKYMSVRIIYRNNVFYYLLMPSLWFSGALIYLGLGWTYAFYLVVKLSVITGAHAEWKWDRFLYQTPFLNKLAWIVERTISTPSTHSAHHGLKADDGITNYKGNYGNLLFFWDVLFGTAKITRRYPAQYGIEGMFYANWVEQLVWPLYKTPRKPKTVTNTAVKSETNSSISENAKDILISEPVTNKPDATI
ncbi:sterol desaturase family protein [Alteromonas sp. 1_MG-2023]|uniref:sterol desaturase family protein n=1 Tax=Alteromonas sp. 1_MG-2023 TaxID=3062669 RepID=UPI0026E4527C|nr:sterol desaturase family protein [Alteromonas sp. 1_MG-2023]MDO6568238.1 sterol desaturase family protein [Alteromonas sp. 1_MG-2023]